MPQGNTPPNYQNEGSSDRQKIDLCNREIHHFDNALFLTPGYNERSEKRRNINIPLSLKTHYLAQEAKNNIVEEKFT